MIILKKQTKSLCHLCFKEIPAKIIQENNQVYMIRNCPVHGEFKKLIEKDATIYKELMNREYLPKEISPEHLMFTATYRCSENCPICYLPERKNEPLSLDTIKKAIIATKAKRIRISGGEPTERDDVMEIISFIHKQNKIGYLITNGLRLIDRSYVKRLKKSGIGYVILAFNGFDDNTYIKINGRKLLDIKLKALKNLIKEKINISLSVMLVRNLNEKELRKIIRFCFLNCSLIHNLRIRNTSTVGRHLDDEPLFLSEIISMIEDEFGLERYELIKKRHRYPIHSVCWMDFSFMSLFIQNRYKHIKNPYIKRFFYLKIFMQKMGILATLLLILRKLFGKPFDFKITVRCRPDINTVDLMEIQAGCPSRYLLRDGKTEFPYCLALILNDHNFIL